MAQTLIQAATDGNVQASVYHNYSFGIQSRWNKNHTVKKLLYNYFQRISRLVKQCYLESSERTTVHHITNAPNYTHTLRRQYIGNLMCTHMTTSTQGCLRNILCICCPLDLFKFIFKPNLLICSAVHLFAHMYPQEVQQLLDKGVHPDDAFDEVRCTRLRVGKQCYERGPTDERVC